MTARNLSHLQDELHEVASRKTGLHDFGDSSYLQAMSVLLEAYEGDLQLTEAGRQNTYRRLLEILVARLYTQAAWHKDPQVLATPIRSPLIVTGLPRTGTTALLWLLSMDDQFQGVETWLARTPMIRPPRAAWESNSEYRACVADLEEFFARVPEARKFHNNLTAFKLTECQSVLTHSFVSNIWLHSNLPTYMRWYLSQSAAESYRRYADVLRLIGAGEPHKRWLLKSPCHMTEIDALFEVFPDANIVHTHRDPLESIPSLCDMLHLGARHLEGESASLMTIGPRECTYWREALDHTRHARQQRPLQFFDVDHRRFRADPLGTVRSIYAHFGLSLAPQAEQKMLAWVGPNAPRKRTYASESWGVTRAQICNTFADYRQQYQFNDRDSQNVAIR
jgi:hypothetical protein